MTESRQSWAAASLPQLSGGTGFGGEPRRPRHHAGEGIEDGYNVPGLVLCALGVIALGLTLTAAGYGFAGWATIAAISCVSLFLCGAAWLYVEWHRELQRRPNDDIRQGH